MRCNILSPCLFFRFLFDLLVVVDAINIEHVVPRNFTSRVFIKTRSKIYQTTGDTKCLIKRNQKIKTGSLDTVSGSRFYSYRSAECQHLCSKKSYCVTWVRQASTGHCWLFKSQQLEWVSDNDFDGGHYCKGSYCEVNRAHNIKNLVPIESHYYSFSNTECRELCSHNKACSAWVRQDSTGICLLSAQSNKDLIWEDSIDFDGGFVCNGVHQPLPSKTGVSVYKGVEGYFEVSSEGIYALVMKLAKNEFCYRSTKWTDGVAYNSQYMLDRVRPNNRQYDAKSLGFHLWDNVKELKLDSNRHGGKVIHMKFQTQATPEKLMTTNEVKFAEYPNWETWKLVFGADRNWAPMMVRNNVIIVDPKPICRTSNFKIHGCGKPCMFCMMAGDGSKCPAEGRASDISTGLGLNRDACGGGDVNRCSSSGSHTQGENQMLIWAKLEGPPVLPPPTILVLKAPTLAGFKNAKCTMKDGWFQATNEVTCWLVDHPIDYTAWRYTKYGFTLKSLEANAINHNTHPFFAFKPCSRDGANSARGGAAEIGFVDRNNEGYELWNGGWGGNFYPDKTYYGKSHPDGGGEHKWEVTVKWDKNVMHFEDWTVDTVSFNKYKGKTNNCINNGHNYRFVPGFWAHGSTTVFVKDFWVTQANNIESLQTMSAKIEVPLVLTPPNTILALKAPTVAGFKNDKCTVKDGWFKAHNEVVCRLVDYPIDYTAWRYTKYSFTLKSLEANAKNGNSLPYFAFQVCNRHGAHSARGDAAEFSFIDRVSDFGYSLQHGGWGAVNYKDQAYYGKSHPDGGGEHKWEIIVKWDNNQMYFEDWTVDTVKFNNGYKGKANNCYNNANNYNFVPGFWAYKSTTVFVKDFWFTQANNIDSLKKMP